MWVRYKARANAFTISTSSSLQVSEVQNVVLKIKDKEFLPRASCLKIRSFVLYAKQNCCMSSLINALAEIVLN